MTTLLVGPGPLPPARRPARVGRRRAGPHRPLDAAAGASATSPTCARSPRWLHDLGRRVPGPQPPPRPDPGAPDRRPAPTPRPAGAGAARCSCGSTRSPAAPTRRSPRWAPGPAPLLADPHVDRDACWSLQRAGARAALGATSTADERAALAAWRAEQGAALEGWARFCALAEQHGAELARLAGRAPPSRRPGRRARRGGARRPDRVPRVAAAAPRPTSSTRRGRVGPRLVPGPRHRRRPRRRRRVAVAGPARRRLQHRRAARRLRARRPAVGPPAVDPRAAPRRAATARSPTSCARRSWPAAACASTT